MYMYMHVDCLGTDLEVDWRGRVARLDAHNTRLHFGRRTEVVLPDLRGGGEGVRV